VAKVYFEVNRARAKALYLAGVNLYLNGSTEEAIRKWKQCLEEDPRNAAARSDLKKALAKLRAISKLR